MIIPLILVRFAYKRADIPYRPIFFLFGLFIVSCGLTHLIGAVEFFWPIYHFGLLINMITVISSLATAWYTYPITIEALKLQSPELLLAANKRFEALLSATAETILLFDKDDTIIDCNKSTERMFLYSNEETLGKKLLDFAFDKDLVSNSLNQMKAGYDSSKIGDFTEAQMIDKNGRIFDCAISFANASVDGEQMYVVIIRDVSARKRLERERKILIETLSARLAALEQFNYMIAHDLNAPLRSMEGFSDILKEDYSHSLDETARDYIERISKAVHRMRALISDMLTLSRIHDAKTQVVRTNIDITDLCRSVFRNLSHAHPDRRVNYTIEDNLYGDGDESLIRIVLENIIGNAWKFTSKKENPCIEVGKIVKDNETIFFVKDNGAGFDMKNYGKLFEPFQRLHHQNQFEGNGIGLTIVRRIILLHGGKVWAEAQLDNGAIFYFTLGIKHDSN